MGPMKDPTPGPHFQSPFPHHHPLTDTAVPAAALVPFATSFSESPLSGCEQYCSPPGEKEKRQGENQVKTPERKIQTCSLTLYSAQGLDETF